MNNLNISEIHIQKKDVIKTIGRLIKIISCEQCDKSSCRGCEIRNSLNDLVGLYMMSMGGIPQHEDMSKLIALIDKLQECKLDPIVVKEMESDPEKLYNLLLRTQILVSKHELE